MEEERTKPYKPFAINASRKGETFKLYTKVNIVNKNAKDGIIYAAEANAMWDTGCYDCIMTKELADKLHCQFSGTIIGRGITGFKEMPLGRTKVALVHNGDLIDTSVAVSDEKLDDEYSFIIGLDFILKGSLAITGGKDNVTLSFTIPPTKEVNFAFERDGMDVTRKLMPLSTDEENIRIYKGEEAERFLNDISEQFFTAD